MFKNTFLISLLIFFSSEVFARQIEIASDKLEILRTDNISVFSGNVYALERNLEIWSEKLIVTSSQDQKRIKEVYARDNVKILREGLSIIGDQARYDPINNTLTVIGKVEVMQNENIIICDEIIVDLENSSSIMRSESTKRVEALIISEDKN